MHSRHAMNSVKFLSRQCHGKPIQFQWMNFLKGQVQFGHNRTTIKIANVVQIFFCAINSVQRTKNLPIRLILSILGSQCDQHYDYRTYITVMINLPHCWLGSRSPYCFNSYLIFTARKRSLRRLCFYRCLSVHGGGGGLA